MNLLISHARVIDPASGRDEITNVCVQDGKILALANDGHVPKSFAPSETVNARGLWLFPGVIDLAAWLREPGLDHKATLASETRAAAASGVTTLCYQPEPATSINNSAPVNLIRDINTALGKVHIAVVGNLTLKLEGKKLSNMGGLRRAGCVGVTNGWQPVADLKVMRRALEYATTHDLTVFVYPLEHELAGGGCVHEGEVSTRLGLPAIPAAAETVAVAQTLALMEMTGTRVHFCRLSAAGSVRLIRQAKQDGFKVTADVAAHQLHLTEMDVVDFNPLCHVQPPLRSQADREALLQGLKDGTIDAICSDHQPHELDAKLAPFQQTEAGISSLETLLPLTLRLVESGDLSLQQALGKLTYQPASVIHSSAGRLTAGAPADLVLFNPDSLWDFSLEKMRSMGKNTPFAGWSFKGHVVRTLLAGKTVFQREAER
ncbi:dihydroorotase [Thiolinea disciformis]|uniref:dihydroorotase n=1 Tax=Thiolinea disciformis TaxID=125614 RepID=UPI00037E5D12|nr:dihydroorotase [Thiolinea disciformis]